MIDAIDVAFGDAISAWQSQYFEGRVVFAAPDPGGRYGPQAVMQL
ncbi:hypothetical protein [Rhizobium ruizarguesonis]|nr:hypothetical protein [Rhizobium ruizarguesonis]MBY5829084.1 hypothetical protein [Rhizobium leguminosarum]QJS28350.1 hypothetical protein RLTA1_14065 [Rhizobium leguminosarum bv. trifolii TA1]QND19674.1 hypothetical protein HB774_05335 [Rhizobium leguminosarum bv. viciae]MBY5857750.1 hypothetical protein [Rhizobium leguminosarum]